MKPNNNLTEAKRVAWHTGNLKYLLDAVQRRMYAAFRGDESSQALGRQWYLNCARQLGKSYFCCVLALEECLRTPGAQVKYASVDQKSARAIVFPQMERLLEDCPVELLPQFRSQDGIYYFKHNGSRLLIAGADRENRTRLRGQQAHLAIVDEGAFIEDLDDLLLSVLMPQTTTTRGRIVVATTPPISAGHPAHRLAMSCKAKGAYAKFTIWDSLRIDDNEKKAICAEYGGEESTRWRREYLCEFVTDTQGAVVPEFTETAEAEIVLVNAVPEFSDAYVSLDGGFSDPAGCLFARVDYARARLVVEDEWLQKGALTEDIAVAVGAKEQALWGALPCLWTDDVKGFRHTSVWHKRIMDRDPSMAAEFSRNHGMSFQPARKQGKDWGVMARVNMLNQLIRQRSIEINPRCVNLIRQLHNATWAGRQRLDGEFKKNDFSRSKEDGHFDLVAALLYMLPEVDFAHNPNPPGLRTLTNQWIAPEDLHPELEEQEEALLRLYKPIKFD